MELLRQFVNSAPIKVDLNFGVNTNVVLRAVSIDPRMHQGTQIKRNTFMTFTQVNPVTRKAMKEHEYSFFNLNHDSEYVIQNAISKLTKLVSIVASLGLDTEKAEAVFEKSFLKFGIVDEIEETVLSLKGAKLVDQALSAGFYEVVKDIIGLDGALMNFKTTVDKKGYLEIPLYSEFIEPYEEGKKSNLIVSMKEYKAKDAAMETKTAGADKLGKKPNVGAGKSGLSLSALGIV